MKLFACMCNQPQRLSAALAPLRAALVAQPIVSRWGLGYIQGGDVLLVRTPKASEVPVDLASPLISTSTAPAEIATDCAIALSVRDDRTLAPLGGTDNTPPFRFRRWLYGQSGMLDFETVAPRLLEHVPEYLRRNIRGRTPVELMFHVFLAMLHDEGNIDDPNLPTSATRRALAATLRLVTSELEKAGKSTQLGTIALSNGRSMVVAKLGDRLRLRRLWVPDDRGNRDASFRGVILVSGSDTDGDSSAATVTAMATAATAAAANDGFEEVPANTAVLVSRDLQVSFTDLMA